MKACSRGSPLLCEVEVDCSPIIFDWNLRGNLVKHVCASAWHMLPLILQFIVFLFLESLKGREERGQGRSGGGWGKGRMGQQKAFLCDPISDGVLEDSSANFLLLWVSELATGRW